MNYGDRYLEMDFMLIGSKDDQRALCVIYYKLLLNGGLKTRTISSKFRNQT
jgi:hypothetical protein